MSQCSSLQEIENLFNQHGIAADSIAKYPEIYTLSPTTVKERLEELDTIPEFAPLKNHNRVIRLLYYQNKAKARIEQFRTLDLTGASLHLLSADTKRFKKLLALGEMKSRGSDMINLISEHLGPKWTHKEIRENLMRHPHWLHCSIMTVKDSLSFIRGFDVFTKEQIFSALPLLLYPKDKIEKEFENVVIFNEAKISDDWFLHMVLYFLERTVHFSGDGVWNSKTDMRDDDDRESPVTEDIFSSDEKNMDPETPSSDVK
jgi:hypothetical protein